MLKTIIEKCASKIKGESYKLDGNLGLLTIFQIALERLRNLLRGICYSRKLNQRVFVGKHVTIKNRRYLCLGKGVTIGDYVSIDGLSRDGISIGNNVSIGPFSILQASGVISNLGAGLKIGDNSGIGAYSYIGAAGGVSIGQNVIMGQYVSFHSENHNFSLPDIPIRKQGVTREGIVIEDDCWVGAKVTFLDGAFLSRGCVVAAGAVVRGVIPPNSVIGGVPAKVIKSRL
ncbi:DapH/DapD/GlmU-related protein [Methylophilus sp. TWE2]|uniref:acyltransferase n=1 Tax=Methylophilus sp. TWE2 TaxID=1662285 RepID=UPI000670CAF7|nr:acyltransferase [Methylophilus sp. TWE2]AKR43386.1 hypothetical protein ACJ67_08065 [Methylophilus sp. TWE2]